MMGSPSSSHIILLFLGLMFLGSNGQLQETPPVAENPPQYFIMSPNTIRPGKSLTLIVNIWSVTEPVTILAVITFETFLENGTVITSDQVLANATATVNQFSSERMTIQVPDNLGPPPPQGSYVLLVRGSGGLTFSHSDGNLVYGGDCLNILIQTDKAAYKPGETIRYRVMATEPDLTPLRDVSFNITIKDASGNLIDNRPNTIANEYSVAEGSLVLSPRPVFGLWSIEVTVGRQKTRKEFLVDEFVLPRFDVQVLHPEIFTDADSIVMVRVESRYTFGQPVTGTAVITLGSSSIGDQVFALPAEPLVNGAAVFAVDVESLLQGPSDPLSSFLPFPPVLFPPIHFYDGQRVQIHAEVTDNLTRITQEGESEITYYGCPLTVTEHPDNPPFFKPGLPFDMQLVVSRIDGRVLSSSELSFRVTYNVTIGDVTQSRVTMPSSNGIIDISLPSLVDVDNFRVEVGFTSPADGNPKVFYFWKQKMQSPSGNYLAVTESTPGNTVGSISVFRVDTTEAPGTLYWQVIAQGNIVQTGSQSSPSTLQFISVTLTQEMAPCARLIAHYISNTNGEVVLDVVQFLVEGAIRHRVDVRLDRTMASPGDTVSVNVNTSPNSFIGLLGIDRSVRLFREGNDISRDDLFSYFRSLDTTPIFRHRYYFAAFPDFRKKRDVDDTVSGDSVGSLLDNAGMIVYTDAMVPDQGFDRHFYNYYDYAFLPAIPDDYAGPVPDIGQTENDVDTVQPAGRSTVRTDFPETWIWTDLTTDVSGMTMMSFTVPDTITTWEISAFGISQTEGLGISDRAELLSRQEFFVLLTLPFSVKRGETFVLQVAVFNLRNVDVNADVSLGQSEDFVFLTASGTVALMSPVSVIVPAYGSASLSFPIRPTSLGRIDITVTASSLFDTDTVVRQLLVKPPGVELNRVMSTLELCDGFVNINEVFNINVPTDTPFVNDSISAILRISGDVLGTAMNNLASLLRKPTGCGEQNMMGFAPDVYVLDYLQAAGISNPNVEETAINFLEIGYQRQLTYKHRDCSFSAFGESKRDPEGSTFLTAFVVKSFNQAIPYISIDTFLMRGSIEFLISKQRPTGEFAEDGRIVDQGIQGGVNGPLAVTAYVLTTLLEVVVSPNIPFNENDIDIRESITLASSFLERQLPRIRNDPFALAICSYALTLANSSQAANFRNALDQLSVTTDDGKVYWTANRDGSGTVVPPPPVDFFRPFIIEPPSTDIETTAYALLTYLAADRVNDGLPIARWLISQQGSFGGWGSTQDTVVGIQALAEFASLLPRTSPFSSLRVSVTDPSFSSFRSDVFITVENAQVLQEVQIPSMASQVQVEGFCSGVLTMSLSLFYNVLDVEQTPPFTFEVDVIDITSNLIQMIACAQYVGPRGATSMSVMELEMLPGFSVLNENLEELRDSADELAREFEMDEGMLIAYFDEIPKEDDVCITFFATRTSRVGNAVLSTGRLYDYYTPAEVFVVSYASRQTQTDICRLCPDCGCMPDIDCDNYACTEQYDPVCDSEGTTHSNLCFFDVAVACRPPEAGLLTIFDVGRPCTPCARRPCQNGGVCTDNADGIGYACRCPTGYFGQNCEDGDGQCNFACTADYSPVCGTDLRTYSNLCQLSVHNCMTGMEVDVLYPGECVGIGGCSLNPCQNGGECIPRGPLYECLCPPGFTGFDCTERDQVCLDCRLVRVACNDTLSQQRCFFCPEETHVCCDNCCGGQICMERETDTDICSFNPCENGGTCVPRGTEYFCVCPLGIGGRYCEDTGPDVTPPFIFNCSSVHVFLMEGLSTFVEWSSPSAFDDRDEDVTGVGNPFVTGASLPPGNFNFRYTFEDIVGNTAFCIVSVIVEALDCSNLVCTGDGRPVCGSNNMTFTDMCALRRFACLPNVEPPSLMFDGPCDDFNPCNFSCGEIFSPVCSTSGITYPNLCELSRNNCIFGDDVELAYDGACGDACAGNPCLNGGTCQRFNLTDFVCYCPFDYSGPRCEIRTAVPDISCPDCSVVFCAFPSNQFCGVCPNTTSVCCDDCCGGQICVPRVPSICSNNPCQNGGTCWPMGPLFECHCPPGYAGFLCEQNVVIDVCPNCNLVNVDCNPAIGSQQCRNCPNNTVCCDNCCGGRSCIPRDSDDTNLCEFEPCQNGGTCFPRGRDYMCNCPVGIRGINCEDVGPDTTPPFVFNCSETVHAFLTGGPTTPVEWLLPSGFDDGGGDVFRNGPTTTTASLPEGTYNLQYSFEDILENVAYCVVNIIVEALDCNNLDCTEDRDSGPVCGSNNVTFTDMCALKQFACLPNVETPSVMFDGPCDDFDPCDFDCGDIFRPICSTEGLTYPNFCELQREICRYGSVADIAYEGPCEDACAFFPCLNGGSCRPLGLDDFYCLCPPSFEGPFCEIIGGEACDPNPCMNGGTCEEIPFVGGHICTCPNGVIGPNCDAPTGGEPCASNPCQNGGSCNSIPFVDVYFCVCPDGNIGLNCGTGGGGNCDPNPCENGGSCLENSFVDFLCICSGNYYGTYCELGGGGGDCDPNPCENGGSCLESPFGDFFCICDNNYYGTYCELGGGGNCDPNPCENGGSCLENSFVDFLCICSDNYYGTYCELGGGGGPCDANPCLNGGSCETVPFSDIYVCSCPPFYFGLHCEFVECPNFCAEVYDPVCGSNFITYSSLCHLMMAGCQDSVVRLLYEGECRNGVCPDGVPVVDCFVQPCQFASCTAYPNAICVDNYCGGCNTDWYLNGDLVDCNARGPCDSRPCQNGGSCEATTAGGYTCFCREGFSGSTCEDDCPSFCPAVFAPVCGNNFVTYGNLCELLIARCQDSDVELLHHGECRDDCLSICTLEYNPQCGNNFVTYGNPCQLSAASCQDSSIELLYEGECQGEPCNFNICLNGGSCETTATGSNCHCRGGFSGTICEIDNCLTFCTTDYTPVCGNNMVTYGNLCELSVAICRNSSIALLHEGECRNNCPTICTLEYNPICGSDFITYGNPCQLSIANCQNPSIEMLYPGECRDGCPDGVPVVDCFVRPCQFARCTAYPDAVCVDNYCGGCNTDWYLNGDLVDCDEDDCPTICTLEYNPVCGSDLVTYGNPCQLSIANCQNPSIVMLYPGECGLPICPDGLPPVECIEDPCYLATCLMNPRASCISNPCDRENPCSPRWLDANGDRVTCDGPCPDGLPPSACFIDPCTFASCPLNPDAECVANYCDRNAPCSAEWFDADGNQVECDIQCPDGFPALPCPIHPCESSSCLASPDAECIPNYCNRQLPCLAEYYYPDGRQVICDFNCFVTPCSNGGSCIFDNFRARCECLSGFTGQQCEIEEDDCPTVCTLEYNPVCGSDLVTYGNPCQLSAASCRDSSIVLLYNGECDGLCPDGLPPAPCFVDPCEFASCQQRPDAQCIANYCNRDEPCLAEWFDDNGNQVECGIQCPDGFQPFPCPINPCDFSTCPASPDAECVPNYCSRSSPCLAEYYYPDGRLVDCNFNCFATPCSNGGNCIFENLRTRCECLPGFGGQQCEIEEISIFPCLSEPCLNGGQCIPGDVAYFCECAPGFTGRNCEFGPPPSLGCPPEDLSVTVFNGGVFALWSVPCISSSNRVLEAVCSPPSPAVFLDTETNDVNCTCQDPESNAVSQCSFSVGGEDQRPSLTCPPEDLVVNPFNGGVFAFWGIVTCTSVTGQPLEATCDSSSPAIFFNDVTNYVNCTCEDPVNNAISQCSFAVGGETVDPCNPSPCQNNGACSPSTSGNANFVCSCQPGFSGTMCEIVDPCDPSPCQNNGVCSPSTTGSGNFVCSCPPGFSGTTCELDPCFNEPCFNGMCVLDPSNARGFTCACRPGFSGFLCDEVVPPTITCPTNSDDVNFIDVANGVTFGLFGNPPCTSAIVGNAVSVTCDPALLVRFDTNDAQSVTCTCMYEDDALAASTSTCTFVIERPDPCSSLPCLNGGICLVDAADVRGFTCGCQPGFFGDFCEQDPCGNLPCLNGGFCTVDASNVRGFTCGCQPGFLGDLCDQVQSPVLTCPTDSDVTFISLPGGNTVAFFNIPECTSLLQGTGVFMECDPSSPITFQTNAPPTVTCTCTYIGINAVGDSATCTFDAQPPNPCANLPCQNGGICTADASNVRGFTCGCQPGFLGDFCEQDPCGNQPCQNGGFCSVDASNVRGFTCSCQAGFSGDFCEQVFPPPVIMCPANGDVSFFPISDGSTFAIFVAPCTSSVPGNGVDVTCDPPSPIRLQTDAAQTVTCTCRYLGNAAAAVASTSSCAFDVQRPPPADPCTSQPCQNDGTCTVANGGFTCSCVFGFAGIRCEQALDACEPNPCLNDGICNPISLTEFSCSCLEPFFGNVCDGQITFPQQDIELIQRRSPSSPNNGVVLTCTVTASSAYTISWYRGTQPIEEQRIDAGGRYTIVGNNNQILVINAATQADAGFYYCLASIDDPAITAVNGMVIELVIN